MMCLMCLLTPKPRIVYETLPLTLSQGLLSYQPGFPGNRACAETRISKTSPFPWSVLADFCLTMPCFSEALTLVSFGFFVCFVSCFLSICLFCFVLFFEKGSCYLTQANLGLMILLSPLSEWCVLPLRWGI